MLAAVSLGCCNPLGMYPAGVWSMQPALDGLEGIPLSFMHKPQPQLDPRPSLPPRQEPNDLAVDIDTFNCDKTTLRALFSPTDNNAWALRFGSRDALEGFQASLQVDKSSLGCTRRSL